MKLPDHRPGIEILLVSHDCRDTVSELVWTTCSYFTRTVAAVAPLFLQLFSSHPIGAKATTYLTLEASQPVRTKAETGSDGGLDFPCTEGDIGNSYQLVTIEIGPCVSELGI